MGTIYGIVPIGELVKKFCGIYCIENKIDKKKYIGQSVDIKERWRHEKQNYQNNRHLTRAINKYGINNFDFFIIEECSEEELDEKEKYYIKKYNTVNQNFGYNMEPGGENHNAWFVKLSKEERNEINKKRSIAQKDKKLTKEHKKILSEAMTKRVQELKLNKKVYCLEKEEVYNSISEAAKKNGIKDDAEVSRCCRKKRISAGGLHFCFFEEKENFNWNLKDAKQRAQELGKKIYCIELKKEFSSINVAVEYLLENGYKVNKKGISRNVRKLQSHCGGLHFILADN